MLDPDSEWQVVRQAQFTEGLAVDRNGGNVTVFKEDRGGPTV